MKQHNEMLISKQMDQIHLNELKSFDVICARMLELASRINIILYSCFLSSLLQM